VNSIRPVILLSAALAAPAAVAGDAGDAQEHSRIQHAITTPTASRYALDISSSGQRRDAGALLTSLEFIEQDPDLESTARTVLVHDALVALAGTPPDPDALPTLRRHAAAPRVVWAWHEDEGHRVAIDLYDTGAAARYAMREWRRAETRDATLAALEQHTWRADASDMVSGIEDAFAAAPVAQVAAARSEIIAALEAGLPLEVVALTAALRNSDSDLAARVVDHGRAHVVLHALDDIASGFPAQDAFMLMTLASEREDIGAAAVAQARRWSPSLPAARGWLLARLGDPRLGAAAAHALSRDPGAISALEDLLAAAAALTRNRAALALYLNGSGSARDALFHALERESLPDDLRGNISTWLR
jgi:hypothetical protein